MEWDIASLEDLEHYIWRCTACGTCKVAYDFGPPSTCAPICPAGTEFGFEGNMSSKGKIAFARGILDGTLEFDEELLDDMYRCTICGGCQNQCQLDHKPFIPEIMEAMRRKAVEAGKGPLPLHKNLTQSLKDYNNPYQGPRRLRTDWARPFKKAKKPIKNIMKEPAEALFYVGCTGAFNQQARAIPTATASLFQKLGLDFGILGDNEVCCGSTAMRVGDAEEFKRLATHNLELFKKLHDEQGVNTIITSCAGCYRAIKKDYILSQDYDQMMDGIRVVHTAQYLHELMQKGELPITGELKTKITYHDPCHIGRHLNKFEVDTEGSELWPGAYLGMSEEDCIYEEPRELLAAIPGVEFMEMERNRSNSYCCGGGGGVMTGFGEWAAKNASLRVEEGMGTGAEVMASTCPFCNFNLGSGAQRIQSPMKIMDVVELLDQVITEQE
ncbi:MAG: (Fe-S)-binding protein [Desulfarculaceae bacterium]|nr:(Fe-S)-binding protein [Desulfarculaceae bacterium]MCF8072672.1 (Fe-S)-binding protein [Desulfarculaceae bacterium]MCF8102551.1 (Fe-S)-binding protein [Desulfarculaceae bacterium]MCF8116460.1 (Fe-S)-binding protein [Desulfarculaceae bacterium]